MERKHFTCMNCQKKFEGELSLDTLGWHTACPLCGASFDVDVPDKRYVIAIAKMPDDDYEQYFVDKFDPDGVERMFTCGSYKELMQKWKKIAANPPSMWYWIVDAYTENGVQTIVSGAIDPGDDEIIREYFDV